MADVCQEPRRFMTREISLGLENESWNSLWEPPHGSPPGRVCRSPPRWCLLAWVQPVRPPNLPPPSKCRHPPLRTIHRLSIRPEAAWRLVRDQCWLTHFHPGRIFSNCTYFFYCPPPPSARSFNSEIQLETALAQLTLAIAIKNGSSSLIERSFPAIFVVARVLLRAC